MVLKGKRKDWDGTWMSVVTALEAEEIWIATLIVHVHTQPQSHPEQWKEMRGRERWVVGGVEWRSGIWNCWWWLLLLCRCVCCLCVPLCAVIVYALCVFGYLSMFSRAYTNKHVHTRYWPSTSKHEFLIPPRKGVGYDMIIVSGRELHLVVGLSRRNDRDT